MDGPVVYLASAPAGLIDVIASMPHLTGAACRGRHELWDAAHSDPLAAEQAQHICLHQCQCLQQCADWVATLSRRQRAELGVVAGIIPNHKLQPVPSPLRAIAPPQQPHTATWTARWDRPSTGDGKSRLSGRRESAWQKPSSDNAVASPLVALAWNWALLTGLHVVALNDH
jgi:hypothetical protein